MILSDTYMTLDFEESPRIAVWDRFTVNRRLRLLCEISVPRNSRKIYCSMAGKKQRSRYRPKRKGKGFGGSKRKGKLGENTPLAEAIIDREKPSTSHEEPDVSTDSECAQPLSSSAKKMKLYHSPDEASKRLDDESIEQCETTGYRLINLESLSSVLSEAHECEEGEK